MSLCRLHSSNIKISGHLKWFIAKLFQSFHEAMILQNSDFRISHFISVLTFSHQIRDGIWMSFMDQPKSANSRASMYWKSDRISRTIVVHCVSARNQTAQIPVSENTSFMEHTSSSFFFFRLLLFIRGCHSGCFQTSAQKIWQCFMPNALPDATY